MIGICRSLSTWTIIVGFALALPAQSNSAFEGKWVFNADKSIFSPGPFPQSETLTFENGEVTVDGVGPLGKLFHMTWTLSENKPVLVAGAPNKALTVATSENGETLVHMWSDHSGTSYGEGRISTDGKTLRYVLIGTRQGNHVYEVSVFDKQ
jgi:hypothetical protein